MGQEARWNPIVEEEDPDQEWPTCSPFIACMEDEYLNSLACNCFQTNHCEDMTCPDGQDLSPLEYCECMPYADIKLMYPDWATYDDVTKSIEEGLKAKIESDTSNFTSSEEVDIPEPIVEPEPEPVDEEEESDYMEDTKKLAADTQEIIMQLWDAWNEF